MKKQKCRCSDIQYQLVLVGMGGSRVGNRGPDPPPLWNCRQIINFAMLKFSVRPLLGIWTPPPPPPPREHFLDPRMIGVALATFLCLQQYQECENVDSMEMPIGYFSITTIMYIISAKTCASCRTRRTPLWRDAEDGTPLCNACGIRFVLNQRTSNQIQSRGFRRTLSWFNSRSGQKLGVEAFVINDLLNQSYNVFGSSSCKSHLQVKKVKASSLCLKCLKRV